MLGVDVDAWLRESGLSAKSRNNIRATVRKLFANAKSHKYLSRENDEMSLVMVAMELPSEIEFCSPGELMEFLHFADDRIIPLS